MSQINKDSKSSYNFLPYQFERKSEQAQLESSRQFLDTMRKRRTIRDFSDEPVPFELIENAIKAAALAPSGANQQPWTFVVISDPKIKQEIRVVVEAEEKESYERRMSQEWLDALAPLGTDWHKPHIEQAPYLIVVFEQAYGLTSGPDGELRKTKHYYAQESVGIAVGILLSSLTHAGLASLTHTPSPMGFLQKILQRPPNERAFVVIPVGYPAPDATVPDITKKPLEQVLVRF